MLGKKELQTNGTFWIAGIPNVTCDGALDLKGPLPIIEVVGELTPAMEPVAGLGANSAAMVPTKDDETNLLVHGSVSQRPGRVTLMGGKTRHRQMLIGGKSTHVLNAAHCIIGAHIPSATHKFASARVRVSNLEEWSVLPGLSTTIDRDAKSVKVQFELPEPITHALKNPAGSLKLFTSYDLPGPSLHGVAINTQTWLEWTSECGSDLEEFFVEFIRPLQSLMAILFDSECVVEELNLRDFDGVGWMQVIGEGIKNSTSKATTPQALLTRADTGLDLIASWMGVVPRLTPIPQILAGTIADGNAYLEAEVLNLCTAVEGFHRRTHPGERRLSAEDIEISKSMLESSDFPDDVRQVLKSALSYLWEPSFPMRLIALAERVRPVTPDVTGQENRWKQAVTEARNVNAHSLDMNETPAEYWEHSFVVARSLRWLLVVVLLLETNVSEETLRNKLKDSRVFGNFVSMSKIMFPRVYQMDPDSSP